jgi:hypothetical protein
MEENNLCKCGCGGYCKMNYIKGHGRKNKPCSEEHKRKIGESNSGKVRTDEVKAKMSEINKGKIVSEETKEKLSKIAKEKGFGLWMIGRKLSEEAKRKGSESRMGHITTEETKRKISEANSGEKNGMYGKTHSDEYKEKLRENAHNLRKNAHTPEANEKNRQKHLGKKLSEETKRKMRIAAINHINEKNGGVCTMHNVDGCKFLDELSIEKGWNLQHALNGGEFYISELGYFVDGYDKEKNIVVEYDEPLHYLKTTGELKQKDIKRQNQIIEHLKCKFYRYNEMKGILYEVL